MTRKLGTYTALQDLTPRDVISQSMSYGCRIRHVRETGRSASPAYTFAWTRRLVEARGWQYEVWSGAQFARHILNRDGIRMACVPSV